MKAALYLPMRYNGPKAGDGWPVSAAVYSAEAAVQSMDSYLAQFQLADESGFDWVTVAEHHYSPFSLNPNPMVVAGALTRIVKRAKIALLGSTIPILNPVRVAEEFAMIDTMSGGRVVAGMLRGTPNEYATYNINPQESRERFEEALTLIKTAWTETEPFAWQGRFYDYRTVSIWPRPVQNIPQIFMSGSSPESAEFAARNRISLGFAFTNVPQAKKAADYYREQAKNFGWTPTQNDFVYRVNIHVADSDDKAMAQFTDASKEAPRTSLTMANRDLEASVAKAGYYGRDAEAQRARLLGKSLQERIDTGQIVIGSPDTAVKQLERIYRDVGCGTVDLTVIHDLGQTTRDMIRLIGEKVLPRIRQFQ
jgi:alkanesulfonate monooxygenase SsuD/methylene tetrahydromethanopterin reductase-like flavin-dependent oxidoreductase (luciferase family)